MGRLYYIAALGTIGKLEIQGYTNFGLQKLTSFLVSIMFYHF